MSIIELRNVSVSYGSREVLHEIDLEVHAGEFVALVGSNGAGKSTMIDVMAGDRSPDKGSVVLLGRPLPTWSARDLAGHRAYLTQHTRLTFDFLVEEVVGFGISMPDDDAIDAAMERGGVSALRGRRITELSGGERRRVHFARLLAQIHERQQSELVLLDEPTASLDPKHAHHLLETTFDLTRSGSAVVVVLHDLNLAATFADRVVLLSGGRLLAEGHPKDVFTSERLEEVFEVPTRVMPHPDHGRPLVISAGAPR
jgi:iron complex transport system ATP-binding protein